MQRDLPLPPEVTVDPATLPQQTRSALALADRPGAPFSMRSIGSELARRLLGDLIVDGTLAVRRYEQRTYGAARRKTSRPCSVWRSAVERPDPGGGSVVRLAGFRAGLPTVPDELVDALQPAAVDHHVHGCFTGPLTRAQFEEALNEGSTDPVPGLHDAVRQSAGLRDQALVRPVVGVATRMSPPTSTGARRAELGRRGGGPGVAAGGRGDAAGWWTPASPRIG